PSAPPAAAPKPAEAVLQFEGITRPPVRSSGHAVWLGRDPACEVSIDEGAGRVARRHAEISPAGRGYKITDNNSLNGTLVNGQRITAPVELFDGDGIQLGMGGPQLRFTAPALTPAVSTQAPSPQEEFSPKTMVVRLDTSKMGGAREASGEPQLLLTAKFGEKGVLSVGREDSCDIRLDGLQISNRHARLTQTGAEVL